MKILFTQDALVNAGAERSHLEILSRFSQEVDVGFVYFYPKHELKTEYEKAGIRLIFLDIPEGYHFRLAIRKLVLLIQSEKPDLLVSCLWRADIITRLASWITGVPLIGTLVNDSYSPLAWKDKKGLKYKVVYWLDRLTAGIPLHWIANAQALADSHVKTLGIKQDKISVVYRGRPVIAPARNGGCDAGASSPELDSGKPTLPAGRQSQKMETDRFVSRDDDTIRNFISYGRLLERKGFQDAICAFSEVIKIYADCTLTIFGDGPYRNQLETLIQNLDLQKSVFLPGKISNPMDALINGYCQPQQSSTHTLPVSTGLKIGTENCPLITGNCFIFPSWYEGFSGALVEAMMAGIPIIASDIPMNLEAVSDHVSALTFPVGNSKTLADKMKWAIEHPEQMLTLGRQAKKDAEERFDIEKIAIQYEQVLWKVRNSK
ncbi:glycosyltransferase family 4 protein [Algoriphagus vanfongensis]|uniref:glycosyltransferase family 4 protein n=1 Tax=Algoriphagus vanfongensis TaxID=426371 RepID=UPI00041DFC98|nr:glycosyltransferase family 4 protein [Algoriphagus vanfongensis]